MKKFILKCLLVGLLLVPLGQLLLSPATGVADTNFINTSVRANTDFYAYVASGENLDVTFTKVIAQAITASNLATDATVTVSRPGASDVTCTVLDTDAVGSPCGFSNLTASQSGIWKVSLSFSPTPTPGHGSRNLFSWNITVQQGSTDIPGRVWTMNYPLVQTLPATIDFYYQGIYGYQYHGVYSDYMGFDSVFQANDVGLTKAGGCESINKSANFADIPGTYDTSNGRCGNAYKLFFAAPANDLPASASTWNGGSDWIIPTIVDPSITDATYSPTAGARSGTLSFMTDHYAGLVHILVDVDNDGSYNGSQDRDIPYGVAGDGAHTYSFDGKNASGTAIPASQILNFKVSINGASPIYLDNSDAERRAGGLELTRINGPAADRTLAFWNDSDFASPDANRCSVTPTTDGTAGVDTTGGVHGWSNTGCPANGNSNNGVNGSWGDYRIIEDRANVPFSANVSAQVLGDATTAPGVPDTGFGLAGKVSNATWLMVAGCTTLGAIMVSRQAKRSRR